MGKIIIGDYLAESALFAKGQFMILIEKKFYIKLEDPFDTHCMNYEIRLYNNQTSPEYQCHIN